jgi:hypothetical protein
MESYKHSCPFCGQHIEYTAGYCGKQMQCPICGQTITFPAILPGRAGSSLRAKSLEPKPARKWSGKAPPVLAFLLNFQHWKMVALCTVPFLIIGVLLAGANFVKNKLADTSTPVAVPTVQTDPQAWQKMADLTKADQVVKARIRDFNTACASLKLAEQEQKSVGRLDPSQRRGADQQMQLAQRVVAVAQQRFDDAFSNYQQLGGTVDYRAQLRNH